MVIRLSKKRLKIMAKLPRPLRDRILAEKIPNEAKTPSGIILPVNVHLDNRAKVVAVGPLVKYVKIGDTVQYFQSSGIPYFQDNKSYIFLKTSDERTDVEFVI